jgi:hypothetical protein
VRQTGGVCDRQQSAIAPPIAPLPNPSTSHAHSIASAALPAGFVRVLQSARGRGTMPSRSTTSSATRQYLAFSLAAMLAALVLATIAAIRDPKAEEVVEEVVFILGSHTLGIMVGGRRGWRKLVELRIRHRRFLGQIVLLRRLGQPWCLDLSLCDVVVVLVGVAPADCDQCRGCACSWCIYQRHELVSRQLGRRRAGRESRWMRACVLLSLFPADGAPESPINRRVRAERVGIRSSTWQASLLVRPPTRPSVDHHSQVCIHRCGV